MATADVVRDTTDTIVNLLRTYMRPGLVDPSRIVAATPDEFADLRDPLRSAVTVFLYRIAVAGELRNGPRRVLPNGHTTRPLLPLELRYLVTPWATNDVRGELEIVGSILQVCYDHSELGASDLQGTSWEPNDEVTLVLESLPLEDHYRIWDAADDVPYRLSLTYVARVVGIAPSVEVHAPPVVEARFGAGS